MCDHTAQFPGFKIQDGDYSLLFDKFENKIVHYFYITEKRQAQVLQYFLQLGVIFSFLQTKRGQLFKVGIILNITQ